MKGYSNAEGKPGKRLTTCQQWPGKNASRYAIARLKLLGIYPKAGVPNTTLICITQPTDQKQKYEMFKSIFINQKIQNYSPNVLHQSNTQVFLCWCSVVISRMRMVKFYVIYQVHLMMHFPLIETKHFGGN